MRKSTVCLYVSAHGAETVAAVEVRKDGTLPPSCVPVQWTGREYETLDGLGMEDALARLRCPVPAPVAGPGQGDLFL